MNKNYLTRRQGNNYTSYRMNSRTDKIIESISKFKIAQSDYVLDAGAADGNTLSRFSNVFNFKHAVGIDISNDAVLAANSQIDKRVKIFYGDILNLPFKNCIFDVVLASAVLEHVKDINAAMSGFYRVLKPGGLLCVTMPNPFYDYINSLFVDTFHVTRYTLSQIKDIFRAQNFYILYYSYFMLFPFKKLALENLFQKIINSLGIGFLLFNHIIVGRK